MVDKSPGNACCAQGLHFSFQEPPLSFQRHQGMNIWSAEIEIEDLRLISIYTVNVHAVHKNI